MVLSVIFSYKIFISYKKPLLCGSDSHTDALLNKSKGSVITYPPSPYNPLFLLPNLTFITYSVTHYLEWLLSHILGEHEYKRKKVNIFFNSKSANFDFKV